MRRVFLGAMMLAAILFISSGSAMAEGTTYKVGLSPWVGWSGVNVADAKDLWNAEGVSVKVFMFESDRDLLAAMSKGLVDAGFFMLGSAVDIYQEGEDVVIVAETDWSHGGDKLVAKNGVELSDKKGGMIGVYLNQSCVTYFLDQCLKSQGLGVKDFKVIEIDDDAELTNKFISGTFEAIVSYDPEAMRAEREGDGYAVGTTADYEGCMPEGIVMQRAKLASIDKEDLKKIFKGYIKAAQWLNDDANWAEYQTILNETTFEDDEDAPYSEADLREMVDSVVIHGMDGLRKRNQDGGGLESYLSDVRTFLQENDKLSKDYQPKDLFDNSVLMETLDELE